MSLRFGGGLIDASAGRSHDLGLMAAVGRWLVGAGGPHAASTPITGQHRTRYVIACSASQRNLDLSGEATTGRGSRLRWVSMPDWSYATITGPLLRRGDHERGRRFVNGFFALLGRVPQGYRVVDMLGHMEPHGDLATELPGGAVLSSALVLAPCVNPEGHAAAAFSRFGCGALTFGPVSVNTPAREAKFAQRDDSEIVGGGGAMLGLDDAALLENTTGSAELFFELDPFDDGDPLEALATLTDALGPRAAAFVLSPQCYDALCALEDESRRALLDALVSAAAAHGATPFLGVPVTSSLRESDLQAWSEAGLSLYLAGAATDDGWCWGGDAQRSAATDAVAAAKRAGLFTLVDAGVRSPREALAIRKAGADLIALGTGLVHVGPGLPKRINETFAYVDTCRHEREAPIFDRENQVRRPWSWAAVLGGAMLVGAMIAGWSAMTAVVLPYDEEFLGKTAEQIRAFNPRVLSFMTHDRITLAGTMVSVGVLYMSLALNVMRKGHDWAQHVVGASGTLGFFSFFAFLGFGYLDPFHAFVTAVSLQLLIQVVVLPMGPKHHLRSCPRLDNDAVWRRAIWGQLAFVAHAAALILAGITILTFGMSVVFVPQDIAYLGCDVHAIEAFDDQLRALIAHDRATFGGMLVSGGVALLLTSMWSFRQGDRWLFWTYLITIFSPYAMTLWIHYAIGYDDQFHLAPVYIGIALLAVGLSLSGRFLLSSPNPQGGAQT